VIDSPHAPVVVLGMYRSGTSCVAGMLAAHGITPPGTVVRNWDNTRGHFESAAVVRLNEAVLAHNGGHWLSPPSDMRWTVEHAVERDALLGHADMVLKDPRTLLTLPFWRASHLPMRVIGIVRAPLAVARSLSSWRQMPVRDGLALWQAHNTALLAAHREATEPFPLLNFDQSETDFLTAVAVAFGMLGIEGNEKVLRQSYERELVHHDAYTDTALADELLKLHAALCVRCIGAGSSSNITASGTFPWAEISAMRVALYAGDVNAAAIQAQRAAAAPGDLSAVAVPVIADLLRAGQAGMAAQVLAGMRQKLSPALADLLAGKTALASGAVDEAVACLTRACAVAEPFWEARQLLPQALRRAGLHEAACTAQMALIPHALYPHGLLATLAEWAWADGDHTTALEWSQQAIIAAPVRRRGRLRTRRATWLRQRGNVTGAERELATAHLEDPAYFAGKRSAISDATAHAGSPPPSTRSAGGDSGAS